MTKVDLADAEKLYAEKIESQKTEIRTLAKDKTKAAEDLRRINDDKEIAINERDQAEADVATAKEEFKNLKANYKKTEEANNEKIAAQEEKLSDLDAECVEREETAKAEEKKASNSVSKVLGLADDIEKLVERINTDASKILETVRAEVETYKE